MLSVLQKVLQGEIFEPTVLAKRKFEIFYYWQLMIVSTNIRVMIQKLGAGEYCSTHEGDKKYVQNFRRES